MLDRTTTDVPDARGRYTGERGAGQLRDAQDPERRLRRVDRAAGGADLRGRRLGDASTRRRAGRRLRRARWATARHGDVDSSARFEGLGRYRASGAFDGGGGRAWIGQWIAGTAGVVCVDRRRARPSGG